VPCYSTRFLTFFSSCLREQLRPGYGQSRGALIIFYASACWCRKPTTEKDVPIGEVKIQVKRCFLHDACPYFSFASPKEEVSKRKGDFFATAPPAKKVALRWLRGSLMSDMR